MVSNGRMFAAGILVVLFFLPQAVTAQVATSTPGTVADVTNLTAVTNGFGVVLLAWDWDRGADTNPDAAGFKVRYEQMDDAADGEFDGFNDKISGTLPKSPTNFDVSGLQHGKNYLFGVQAVSYPDRRPAERSSAYVTRAVETLPAPAPGKVKNVKVTAGDGMLLIEWDAPEDNGVPIVGYEVQIEERDASGNSFGSQSWRSIYHEGVATMATIFGLQNDRTYAVRVRADNGGRNDDDENPAPWSADDDDAVIATPTADAPTPTPTLPLFGVIGLGAGLLAVGRTLRRRRRMQRQSTIR